MRLIALVFAATSAGCHMGLAGLVSGSSSSEGIYRAGTIGHELGDDSVRTLGCLDIGLRLIDRPNARDGGTSLVELHVGNRCSHPEAIDFGQIRIEGTGEDERTRIVGVEDPRHEIVKLHVGPGERGRELVRLNTSVGLVRLSFDMDAVAPDAPHAHPAPVHFARESPSAGWTAVAVAMSVAQ